MKKAAILLIAAATILSANAANAQETPAATTPTTSASASTISTIVTTPEIIKTKYYGSNDATIFWKDVPDAIGYYIYSMKYMGQELTPESVKNHGDKKIKKTEISTLPEYKNMQLTSYSVDSYDENGKYYYVIVAVDKDMKESKPSEPVSLKLEYKPVYQIPVRW